MRDYQCTDYEPYDSGYCSLEASPAASAPISDAAALDEDVLKYFLENPKKPTKPAEQFFDLHLTDWSLTQFKDEVKYQNLVLSHDKSQPDNSTALTILWECPYPSCHVNGTQGFSQRSQRNQHFLCYHRLDAQRLDMPQPYNPEAVFDSFLNLSTSEDASKDRSMISGTINDKVDTRLRNLSTKRQSGLIDQHEVLLSRRKRRCNQKVTARQSNREDLRISRLREHPLDTTTVVEEKPSRWGSIKKRLYASRNSQDSAEKKSCPKRLPMVVNTSGSPVEASVTQPSHLNIERSRLENHRVNATQSSASLHETSQVKLDRLVTRMDFVKQPMPDFSEQLSQWQPCNLYQPSLFSNTTSDACSLLSSGEISFMNSNGHDEVLAKLDDMEGQRSRSRLAKELVEAFLQYTAGKRDDNRTSETGSNSSSSVHSSGHTRSRATTLTSTSSSSPSIRKRHNEEDEDDVRRPRRHRTIPNITTSMPDTLLACPYAKYDFNRYSERNDQEKHYRGCSSSYLKDISRVKQHLYRVHRKPPYHCPRCFITLKSGQELSNHLRDTVCSLTSSPFEEKMTSDQEIEIRRREMNKDAVDAWYDIYKILFPNASLPSSPYADSTASESMAIGNFLDYFQRDGARFLSATTAPTIYGADSGETSREYLQLILEEAISNLVQHYRDSGVSNTL